MQKLFFLLFLTGCGVLEPNERPDFNRVISVNGFQHYISLFQEQAKELNQEVTISDLVIRFKHIPIEDEKIVLGRCWLGGGASPTIDIDPEHWDAMSMTTRQLLMFHEMGHCVLRRDHVEGFVSIMNPYLLGAGVFIKEENRILAELFDASTYGSMGLRGDEDDSDYHSRCDHFHGGVSAGLGNEVGHP